ncbi:MAG: CAP domain-containing protein [Candidatus Woesearchaeota archaeon]
MRHAKIVKILLHWINSKRINRAVYPIQHHALLTQLAKNHSQKMMKQNRTWVFKKQSALPRVIKNPFEASIASALIVLGFIIAWVFALVGLLLKKYGRQGYIGKRMEYVAVISVKRGHGILTDSEKIAQMLFAKLSKVPGYLQTIINPEFKLIGIGVVKKKHLYYITQIFYG